ncbi:peptidase S8/S53 domain-containing protein [Rhexocercosporidium sp. MPI-PUGE-AT-0058]|nr:peptidase S8/S53 domain-containing protein [Rhexocercosporidium sp. MPI-PUGE-AT-0058]
MKLLLSLLLASCLSTDVLAKCKFSYGVIIEYEDWAAEDNSALLDDVKATVGRSNQVDEVDVKPRIELSSSIFRGVSASISGVGNEVSADLIQSKIQNLRVVKKVSPISILRMVSPVGSSPYSGPESRRDYASLDVGIQVTSKEENSGNTESSTHVMTGVDKLHGEGFKGKGIKIAIMDSGFDYKQDALGNAIGPGHKVTYGYDWVGDDYNADNPDTVAVEDNDPYADCSIHGTHVFGIVGSNPTKFGVSGVAPEATYELHRVFGCQGTVSNDVAIKASIAIYERGVDVITASIGAGSVYPDGSWSTVAQRINQNGTYFQLSAGNLGSGYYTGIHPATGIDVPAIGAVYNTETPFYEWSGNYTSGATTTDLKWVPGDQISFPPVFNLWTASSEESDILNTGCGPYPSDLELPDFNTTAVLVGREWISPCDGYEVQDYLASIGVKYTLFYIKQPDNPVTGPYARFAEPNIAGLGSLRESAGKELFSAYQKDKTLTVSLSSSSAYNDSLTVMKNDIAGGRMTHYSSWGPTLDGRTYPTISAPGGQILSIYPRRLGGFGQISGTSMAAPFSAGVAALLMQKHPDWDSATIRNVLSTTGNPMPYNDNSTTVYDFLAPVFQQGGGLINAYRAVHTTTIVNVPSLSFNDTANQPKSLSFKVKNIGIAAQTYKLSHIGAASGFGISSSNVYKLSNDDTREVSNSLQAVYATLEITPSEVTIYPGQESTITVALTKLPNLDRKRLPFYGGYIALNSTDGTQTITVPYSGIATSVYDTPINITGSSLGAFNSTTLTVSSVEGPDLTVFNITYNGSNSTWADGIWPALLIKIDSAITIHTFQLHLLKGNGDLFFEVGTRSNSYRPGLSWPLDGTNHNNTFIPAGEYKFRLSVLKIYGDKAKDTDWISTVSEPFVLRYTPESVGLPSNSTVQGRNW